MHVDPACRIDVIRVILGEDCYLHSGCERRVAGGPS
jgi:hypothetical protein